ncbi:MAG: hypothetical protein EOP93_19760 [Lysobacteraceae bacterium]|nr:MAG: hypothetical protein EOP93_19760 [Xanthomonadaceae bacterium]
MALQRGDLGGIANALCAGAGLAVDDLDGVRAHLDDPAQARALAQLQAARWGSADTGEALAALRSAFAGGARWRVRRARGKALLPPLYPEP